MQEANECLQVGEVVESGVVFLGQGLSGCDQRFRGVGKVESSPWGGNRPWQVLVLWPLQGVEVATRGGVSWRLNRQSQEPIGSRQPARTGWPVESMTSTRVLVKVTVQSESPRLLIQHAKKR